MCGSSPAAAMPSQDTAAPAYKPPSPLTYVDGKWMHNGQPFNPADDTQKRQTPSSALLSLASTLHKPVSNGMQAGQAGMPVVPAGAPMGGQQPNMALIQALLKGGQ